MRLLDRYLFRELLAPMVYCLGGFLIFWITFQLFGKLDDLQSAKLHLLDTLELCAAWTPECLATVLPVALLLALLYTLTHQARHNEITAMRAAGMSLWRICAPYFVVGFIASLALFALNELAVPRSSDWADRIMQRYTPKQEAHGNRQQLGFQYGNRTWKFDEFRYKSAELSGAVMVTWTASDGSSRILRADRAARTSGVWVFYNATLNTMQSPLLQTNVLAMPQFEETPQQFRIELRIAEYQTLATRKTVVPLKDILEYMWLVPGAKSAWLRTQMQQHLASPWTCLVVVLIAIPFGAASGRRNLFFGVAGSIFICFVFFVLQSVSVALGYGGNFPPWLAAWLPNMAFGATGVALIARVR